MSEKSNNASYWYVSLRHWKAVKVHYLLATTLVAAGQNNQSRRTCELVHQRGICRGYPRTRDQGLITRKKLVKLPLLEIFSLFFTISNGPITDIHMIFVNFFGFVFNIQIHMKKFLMGQDSLDVKIFSLEKKKKFNILSVVHNIRNTVQFKSLGIVLQLSPRVEDILEKNFACKMIFQTPVRGVLS